MTSHPSPFHRHRQSNKTLDPTGQTAKFLFTILKQLDLKNVDWNEVASGLDITNGHAARMRWSRFRAQIEGLDNSYSRKGKKRRDGEKRKRSKDGSNGHVPQKRMKVEAGAAASQMRPANELEGFKPTESVTVMNGVNIHHPTVTTITMPPTQTTPNQRFAAYGTQNLSSASIEERFVTPPSRQWLRRSFNTNYTDLSYGHSMLTPYSASRPVYAGQYGQPMSYSHSQAQSINHGQQYKLQPQYMYGNYRPSLVANTRDFTSAVPHSTYQVKEQVQPLYEQAIPVSQPRIDAESQQAPAASPLASTSAVASSTQDRVMTTARALAAHESYPWPYREDAVPKFVEQASELVRLGGLTNKITALTAKTTAADSGYTGTETGAVTEIKTEIKTEPVRDNEVEEQVMVRIKSEPNGEMGWC